MIQASKGDPLGASYQHLQHSPLHNVLRVWIKLVMAYLVFCQAFRTSLEVRYTCEVRFLTEIQDIGRKNSKSLSLSTTPFGKRRLCRDCTYLCTKRIRCQNKNELVNVIFFEDYHSQSGTGIWVLAPRTTGSNKRKLIVTDFAKSLHRKNIASTYLYVTKVIDRYMP